MSESTEIIRRSEIPIDEIQATARLLLASGYFAADRNPQVGLAQMVVKILAGREMGYGPYAAVSGIHIIQGRPTLSANLMAAAVKSSGRYDYRVRKMDDTEVSVEFFALNPRESLGVSTFTVEDAKRAGTQNIQKFPRNMLFARAISNGVRWFCPDVFSGNAVYVPEEMGQVVDGETGEISVPATSPQPEPPNNPFEAPTPPARITDIQRRHLHAVGVQLYMGDWDAKRHELVKKITGGRAESSAELTEPEAHRLIDGIEKRLRQVEAQEAQGVQEAVGK